MVLRFRAYSRSNRDINEVLQSGALKRLTGDPREIDYDIKIIKARFKNNHEVEVYSRLNYFDYEIIVIGKKKYLKEVFGDMV